MQSTARRTTSGRRPAECGPAGTAAGEEAVIGKRQACNAITTTRQCKGPALQLAAGRAWARGVRRTGGADRSGVGLRLQYLAAPIETGRADVMAQMRLAGGRLDRGARRA